MKLNPLRFFKSLSARLLLLTLIWVSFIVTTIGYTMMLNWKLESSSAATNIIGDIRFHVFRTALYVLPQYDNRDFDNEVRTVNAGLDLLQKGDQWRPLLVPETQAIRSSLQSIDSEWKESVLPHLTAARGGAREPMMGDVNLYVEKLAALTNDIDEYRAYFLWQLRYLQGLLIVLAIGSLFAIMALLLRWVIRPLEQLGGAIGRLSSGDLTARTEVRSEDEIGEIAAGFNEMAARLKDSHDNLEQKVAEKTASVEEKNSHLAQLYEMTSYFTQRRSLDDLADGFVSRIMRQTEADACTLQLLSGRDDSMQLLTAEGLSVDLVKAVNDLPGDAGIVPSVLSKTYPVCFQLTELEDEFSRRFADAGFKTAYSFQIRSTPGDLGIFTLFFKESPQLTTQVIRLLENFVTHFGVAVASNRLIERDRQFAVVQERQLLAQGLHDSIAQALSFLNLQVQFLSDAIRTNDVALRDESLSAIRTGVQECYEDVRELLLNFRERLHKEGFIEGVRTVIDRFEGQSRMNARLRVSGRGPQLTPRQKLQVIFIIQEALSNVRKHSHAENVDIRIENDADLKVTITDDGVGIDDALVTERKGQHVGLSIMA
ncbi:MAG: HAMP domain-containing protein, partial [Sutterella wadsworthensis]